MVTLFLRWVFRAAQLVNPGQLSLAGIDPFLGSGTTMKVAMSMNRNCIGYELDKSLKSIIKKKENLVNKEKHKIQFKTRKDALSLRKTITVKT